MVTRTGKLDVSETDVEDAASIFDNGRTRSPEVTIVVIMPCVDFAKVVTLLRSILGYHELASLQHSQRNRIGRHEDLHTDVIQQRRIRGKNFQGEQDRQQTLFGVGTGHHRCPSL